MTRIDAASALRALLKSHTDLAGRTNTASTGSAAAPRRAAERGEESSSVRGGAPLEPQLVQKIRGIAENDPERRRKVFRAYLESVLLKRLGPSLGTDREFAHLVDRVLSDIEEDTELRESSLAAADVLVEQCRRTV